MKLLILLVSIPAFAQFGAAKSVIHGLGAPSSALCANINNVGRVYARQDGAAAGSTFYVCANTAASTYAWELAGTGGGGSGTAAAPYDAAVTAQTTLTVAAATHGQGTAPIAMCFDGTTPFVASACSYTRATNGDIVFTWSPAFTGRVTIIGGGTGSATFTSDARTTTTEALVTADCGQAITFSNASAIAASLPALPLADGCVIAVKNIGAGDVTITPASGTISGAAAVTVSLGEMGWITSNGTNYEFLTTRVLAGTGVSLTKARISTTAAVDTATILTRATDQAGTDKYCRSTTGNDTYTCTLTPTLTAYATGMCLVLNADTANTGTATVNVDALGAKSILNYAGSALSNNDILANVPKTICYDGTQFIIQGDGGSGGSGLGDPGSNGVVVRTALNTTTARTITGTASQIDVADGSGVSGNPTISLSTRTFRVDLLNGRTMPDTSGSVFMQPYTITATNDFWGYNVWVFADTSTDLKLYTVLEIPQNFVSGAKACVVWTSTATSGNVVWGAPYRVVSGDDTTSLDQATAQTTPTAVTDAAPTATDRRLRTCITLTDADFSSLGTLQLNFQRNGTSGSDTMAASATVHALELEYQGR